MRHAGGCPAMADSKPGKQPGVVVALGTACQPPEGVPSRIKCCERLGRKRPAGRERTLDSRVWLAALRQTT
jgi:hypothetical protein